MYSFDFRKFSARRSAISVGRSDRNCFSSARAACLLHGTGTSISIIVIVSVRAEMFQTLWDSEKK